MKANKDKSVENLVGKMMHETKIESTSIHFTSQVMSKIEALKSSKITVYKPLISKPIWSMIGFAILATCLYLFLNTPSNQMSWFSQFNLDSITNNRITQTVSGFKLSKTLMYAIIFLSLMICVQIPLLKNHFDKRYEA